MTQVTNVRKIARILCPTDFSACAKGALIEAKGLAELTGAEIGLLHVFQDPAYILPLGGYAGPLSDVLGEARAQSARDLDALAVPLREQGMRVETTMMHGIPHKAIVDRAEEWKADVIVMGTHGRTGIERVLSGSVAERVVRLASCSVLVTSREA